MSQKHSISPEVVKGLPTGPGVYLFKGPGGEVLYVGKAKSLRSRVRSYFGRETGRSIKTSELVRRAADLETIVVGSEPEALILEANLIKAHTPRFNIQLKDDKRYPYIKVTTKERFPRVYVTRTTINDGSRYFGPYTSVSFVRQALEVVKRLYTVRSCRYDLPKDAPARACLDHHIGRCLAPCVGLQSEEDYGAMIDEILRILEGDTDTVRAQIETRMKGAAGSLEFEQAAKYRDVLTGLDVLAREQRVQKFGGGSYDVVGLARDGDLAVAVALRVRRGTLLGRDTQRFASVEEEPDDALIQSFVSRYYLGRGELGISDLPREVLLPTDFADRELVGEVLSLEANRQVGVRVPARGEKKRLVELAADNARQALEDRVIQLEDTSDRADRTLYDLQDHLGMKVVPRLILCFDVSHLQGSDTVASAVVFENGEPKKSEYRRMRIRGEWGNDDFQSMREAVRRALERRVREERPLPDLLLVDGGKGQLGAALAGMQDAEAAGIAVAALAKREEEVFLPGRADPIRIDPRRRALHLLQRLRNEAHRFAVSYNRKLRRKRTIRSDLADVPGIGPRRQQLLLERFGSVRGIRQASENDLARVPGVSKVLASRILAYLGRA